MSLFNKISIWCVAHFRPLFFILLCGLVATGISTQKGSWMLQSPHLPYGAISWQLNTKDSLQREILKDWAAQKETVLILSDSISHRTYTGLKVAEEQNRADYPFIGFYVCILILVFLRLAVHGHLRYPVLCFALIGLAGLADVFEDIGTFRALHAFPAGINSYWIFVPAVFKWLSLLFLIIYLISQAFHRHKWGAWIKSLSDNLTAVAVYLWQFRIVFITLLLFFLVLFLSDQGQDLLVTINSTRKACVFFLISVTVLAGLCWHLPKAIDNAAQVGFCQFWHGPVDFAPVNNAMQRPGAKVDIGRILGCMAFVIPAAGILQTMQKYAIDYFGSGIPPVAVPFFIAFIYTVILQYNLIDKIYKKGNGVNKMRYWGTVLLALGLILYWGFDDEGRAESPDYLIYLSLDLFILSFLFLVTTTLRTCDIALYNWKIAPWITFGGLISALVFIAFNFKSVYQFFIRVDRFWTMPVVFCGIAGYLLFFAFLLYIGKRTKVRYVNMLLLVMSAIAVFKVSDYHNVHVEHQDDYKPYTDSLDCYAENWLKSRRTEIAAVAESNTGKRFPVFFVNAYGGGIRAAAWTAMVIGSIDELVMNGRNNDPFAKDFQHYVFSGSGASGGSIGLSLLAGSRFEKVDWPGKDTRFYPKNILPVFSYDYLTGDVVGLLGRDAVASAFGLSAWDDRGRIQEEDWERHLGDKGVHLAVKMKELMNFTGYEMPLFFSNTHDAGNGKKGVVASLPLDSLDFPGAEFPEQEFKTGDDIRLSTAAFLSARFPYVSPTAKIYGKHNFTDGGTWDNSGAETSAAVISVFERVRAKLALKDTVYKYVSVQILSLPNAVEPFKSNKPVHIFEPLAPPNGLLSLITTVAAARDGENKARAKRSNYGYTMIRPKLEVHGKEIRFWPVLPLGWQISDFALDWMQGSLNNNRDRLKISQLCIDANMIISKKSVKK